MRVRSVLRFPSRRWSAALAALLLWALLALAVFRLTGVADWDVATSRWFVTHREPAFTEVMLFVSRWHSTPPLLVGAALIAVWLLVHRERLWLLRLVAAVPGGMLLNVGLKNLFQRARPLMDEPLVHLTTFSFPSGHAVGSTVFWGWIALYAVSRSNTRRVRVIAVPVAAAIVLTVMFSRVYLGAHYPTDVVAGGLVGLAWLAAILAVTARRP